MNRQITQKMKVKKVNKKNNQFNQKNIRKEFPILSIKINKKNLVYLDNAATVQKPKCVIDALQTYYLTSNANVHRGLYALSEKATEAYESSRKTVAEFICASSKEIIFVRNTTEGINIVANLLASKINEGDTILLTELEHHSNLVPWQILAKKKKANLLFVPITKEGLLDMQIAKKLLQKKPKIFSFTHVSNALGTINPVKELTYLAHKEGATVVVDGAQSVGHMQIDVKELDVDFFAFSGHKMYGPMGIGVLYGKKELLENLEPVLFGGEMIKEVTQTHATWNDLPWKFEAGTPAVSDAVALGVSCNFMLEQGIENIRKKEEELTEYAQSVLGKIKHLKIYGPSVSKKGPIITFTLGDVHPHDISSLLDQEGIAIRAGHLCAQPLIEKLGVFAVCRASFAFYNTKEEIDALAKGLIKVAKVFRL